MKIVDKKKFIRSISIIIGLIIFIILMLINTSLSHTEINYKQIYISSGDTLWNIAKYEQENNIYFEDNDIFGLGDAEFKEDLSNLRDGSADNLALKKTSSEALNNALNNDGASEAAAAAATTAQPAAQPVAQSQVKVQQPAAQPAPAAPAPAAVATQVQATTVAAAPAATTATAIETL